MIFIISICLSFVSVAARADTYKLQPGDEVEIWVAQDERMNRDAVVSPDGNLSLPLVGQIQAQDQTVDQLEATLTEKLAGFFKGELNLSVMLKPGPQHMPMVYVVGDVDAPGAFPYRPTMTVLHAVTVAGGLYRTPMEARDQDRAVVVEGQIDQSRKNIAELTVRIARINSELAGQEQVILPDDALPELSDAEKVTLLNREKQVLDAHIAEFQAQKRVQQQLNDFGVSGTDAIRRQIESVKNRVALAKERLAATASLVSKGLSHKSAQLELEAEVGELNEQGDQLQSELSALESTSVNERSRIDTYFTTRQSSLLAELHESERQLEAARNGLVEAERVMSIYRNTEMAERRGITAGFTVIRTHDGKVTEAPAEETTLLQPGDLVRVTYQQGGQRSAALADGTQPSGN
ncbi:polysaccharide biosynthesis/export family protein [Aureimonas frigidaquae]|nr:polysaccharide biosynthesis/export family protein [Aureimonas frigidaquae]